MDAVIETPTRLACIDQLIAAATTTLAAAGVGTPQLDVELLLAAASGLDRTALYTRGSEPVPSRSVDPFRAFLARRVRREPVQYIVGRQEFWSLEFVVTPDVLIPRPETELLLELAISVAGRASPSRRRQEKAAPQGERRNVSPFKSDDSCTVRAGALEGQSSGSPPVANAAPRLRICDVGTGSGCIAVALAHELPGADVWALDVSMRALAVAELNAQRLGVADRVRFLCSDLFASAAHQRFDIVLANPPYLTDADLANLQPEVAFEPRAALDGGTDGLDIIRRLLAAAPDHLVEGGRLLMEIGASQAAAVEDLACTAGFKTISVRSDYAGLPRVLMAQR